MIISNNTSTSVEVILSGAVTTSQLKCIAVWVDSPSAKFESGQTATSTNNTTAVELVPAITDNSRREVKYISIYNADTVDATVTIRLNISGAFYTILKVILNPNDQLIYNS